MEIVKVKIIRRDRILENLQKVDQDQLALAISIAVEAHKRQTDNNDEPYILHCLRVMNTVRDWAPTMATAVLHDVLEDTDLTAEGLRKQGIIEKVITSVLILTRTKAETHTAYIKRVMDSGNEDAIQVKLADLKDNMSFRRIGNPSWIDDKEAGLMVRYMKAITYMLNRGVAEQDCRECGGSS